MLIFAARRLLGAALTLLGVLLFTHIIFFQLSADPAVIICGQTCTPERIESIREVLGLDRGFWVQFGTFVSGLFVGSTYGEGATAVHCAAPCLGYSFQSNQDVTTMIVERLPVTLTLGIGAGILWLSYGVLSGLISAYRKGTWVDHSFNAVALAGIALPNYFVALILQYVLVVKLQVLPFPTTVAFRDDPGLWFDSYLMPWVVLALMYAAMYTRITRANVLDTLSENYMRTARAKGLAPRTVLLRHALRPSLTPVLTLYGMDLAALLGGALITETVFGLNGVGKLARDAITDNDQPVIMGVTLLAAFIVIVANIVVDMLYAALDPRIRTRAS
ncbi:ABC transporter permease [Ornithinimicrobium avium]|uniref:ABC transporter permease n=1 Tax=Ornithinimicrobium avium TaxID=2283195 RepID=A0A345NMW6_9MICO|nr:ABC transporter permease [Ornithinimicrobium avium]AXH96374.1 ABC transporter permease [Ornithinimicrobium avium]